MFRLFATHATNDFCVLLAGNTALSGCGSRQEEVIAGLDFLAETIGGNGCGTVHADPDGCGGIQHYAAIVQGVALHGEAGGVIDADQCLSQDMLVLVFDSGLLLGIGHHFGAVQLEVEAIQGDMSSTF